MTYTFDENTVSDLHKDARGFRPGNGWWGFWNDADNAARQRVWDSLCVELREELDAESRRQAAAEAALRQQIADTLALGADSDETALRWIFDAEGIDDFDRAYGANAIAFHFDLSYQNTLKPLIERALA